MYVCVVIRITPTYVVCVVIRITPTYALRIVCVVIRHVPGRGASVWQSACNYQQTTRTDKTTVYVVLYVHIQSSLIRNK